MRIGTMFVIAFMLCGLFGTEGLSQEEPEKAQESNSKQNSESNAEGTEQPIPEDLPDGYEKYIGHHDYHFLETFDDIEFDKTKKEPLRPLKSITEIGPVRCAPSRKPPGNMVTPCIYLPDGAELVQINAYMRNYSWAPGGRKCRADMGDTEWHRCPLDGGECPIGWSKAFPRVVNPIRVCVSFQNWKHDNHRAWALRVYYRE